MTREDRLGTAITALPVAVQVRSSHMQVHHSTMTASPPPSLALATSASEFALSMHCLEWVNTQRYFRTLIRLGGSEILIVK